MGFRFKLQFTTLFSRFQIMTIRHPASLLLAPLCALFLCSCERSVQDTVQETFGEELRGHFISSATAICVEKAPKSSAIPSDTVQQICSCASEKTADQISIDDMSKLIGGEVGGELKTKIKQSAVECAKEMIGAASAPSSKK